jgi:sialate O-acetylesterase
LFPALINDWRKVMMQDDFPFYFVQLAPFRYQGQSPEALPEVWDAQLSTLKTQRNVGMVVTTDIGDVHDIHPTNKQEVGRRLSLIALADTYVHQLPADKSPPFFSGPIYEDMVTMGNKIRLTFRHVGGGLEAMGGEPLGHFTICGNDQKFVPAIAEIDGNAVIVHSPEVDKPIAVRFAWVDTAQPNLFNAEGMPASPFRTDTFELQSKDRNY